MRDLGGRGVAESGLVPGGLGLSGGFLSPGGGPCEPSLEGRLSAMGSAG